MNHEDHDTRQQADDYLAGEAADFYDREQAFYRKPYAVTCIVCGKAAYSTESELRHRGWKLTSLAEFCPEHNGEKR